MRIRVLLVSWTALIVAAAAVTVGVWLHHRHTDRSQEAADQALSTARSTVTTLLTYQGSKLSTELNDEERLLAPAYAGTYRSMVLRDVEPVARAKGATVAAAVVAAGVEHTSADEVETLLFVNVTSRTQADVTPVTQGSRLRVTLQKSSGTWLVSDITPL